jgi:hypothetical protein
MNIMSSGVCGQRTAHSLESEGSKGMKKESFAETSIPVRPKKQRTRGSLSCVSHVGLLCASACYDTEAKTPGTWPATADIPARNA